MSSQASRELQRNHLYVESFVIFGQLHPEFVAFAAGTTWLEDLNWELTLQLGEALERNPQKTPFDPFWRYVFSKTLVLMLTLPLKVLTPLAIPHFPI